MINFAVISGTVLDAAGNPVPNASIVFNPVVPQVIQGQYIQPVIVDSLTGDDGDMIPISLPWGLMVEITVNSAAPFAVMVPAIGAVSFGALAMNAWPVLTFNPPTFFLLEDFLPTNTWVQQSLFGAPTVTQLTAEPDHYGITRLMTAAIVGQGGALAPTSSPAIQVTNNLVSENNWQMAWTFRLGQIESTRLVIGLLNDFTTPPAVSYLGLRYDSDIVDLNFHFVASNGGGPDVTAIDTGIVADTAWHSFKIAVAAAGTLLYSLDNGPPQAIATNLPAAGLTPAAQIITTDAVTRYVDLDYFSLAIPSLTR